jgi:hypothetical protein
MTLSVLLLLLFLSRLATVWTTGVHLPPRVAFFLRYNFLGSLALVPYTLIFVTSFSRERSSRSVKLNRVTHIHLFPELRVSWSFTSLNHTRLHSTVVKLFIFTSFRSSSLICIVSIRYNIYPYGYGCSNIWVSLFPATNEKHPSVVLMYGDLINIKTKRVTFSPVCVHVKLS